MLQEEGPEEKVHTITILSLFPDYFRGPLDVSILKRAQAKGRLQIELVDIRTYSQERFRKVDDRPYGGGPGMVLMADPVVRAIRDKKQEGSREVYLSPQGQTLTAKKCRELAGYRHIILLCGHYEGIDQRAIDSDVDEEISIGDFVLTNGCLASLVVIDGMCRFIPGVLGDEEAAQQDSFETGLLDWPQYTRPEIFEEKRVPDVLLTGNHAQIAAWRKEQAIAKTKNVRPDLWEKLHIVEKRNEQA